MFNCSRKCLTFIYKDNRILVVEVVPVLFNGLLHFTTYPKKTIVPQRGRSNQNRHARNIIFLTINSITVPTG